MKNRENIPLLVSDVMNHRVGNARKCEDLVPKVALILQACVVCGGRGGGGGGGGGGWFFAGFNKKIFLLRNTVGAYLHRHCVSRLAS